MWMPQYSPAPVQPELPLDQLAPLELGPLTLFRLDAAESPLRKPMGRWMGSDAPPAELMQYLLLVEKAKASTPLEAVPVTPAELPPVVVRAVPESGAKGVPLDVKEIRVTFSKDMKDKSWS